MTSAPWCDRHDPGCIVALPIADSSYRGTGRRPAPAAFCVDRKRGAAPKAGKPVAAFRTVPLRIDSQGKIVLEYVFGAWCLVLNSGFVHLKIHESFLGHMSGCRLIVCRDLGCLMILQTGCLKTYSLFTCISGGRLITSFCRCDFFFDLLLVPAEFASQNPGTFVQTGIAGAHG